MIYKFTPEQRVVLLELVLKNQAKYKNIIESAPFNDKSEIEVELSDEDAFNIEQLCSKKQLKIGFGEEYNFTQEGKILDEIINLLLS